MSHRVRLAVVVGSVVVSAGVVVFSNVGVAVDGGSVSVAIGCELVAVISFAGGAVGSAGVALGTSSIVGTAVAGTGVSVGTDCVSVGGTGVLVGAGCVSVG